MRDDHEWDKVMLGIRWCCRCGVIYMKDGETWKYVVPGRPARAYIDIPVCIPRTEEE